MEKKGGKKKFFFFAALAGAGAFLFKKLRRQQRVGQLAILVHPDPDPGSRTAPGSRRARPLRWVAATLADPGPGDGVGDAAGATPGESLSDAAEEPHPVTTPDAPAEEVEVT